MVRPSRFLKATLLIVFNVLGAPFCGKKSSGGDIRAYTVVQRTLFITTVFVTKDFAVIKKLNMDPSKA